MRVVRAAAAIARRVERAFWPARSSWSHRYQLVSDAGAGPVSGILSMVRLEQAHRNHALVEGAPDPHPVQPDRVDESRRSQ